MSAARPSVTLKVAMTLDGRTATREGRSVWITGAAARSHCRAERGRHDAILVGVGTVLADDPRLTVRDADTYFAGAVDPIRVVLDSRLRTPPDAQLLAEDGVEVLLCTTTGALRSARARVLAERATLLDCGPGPQVDIERALLALGERGVTSVFVEGGAEVHGALLDARLVDRCLVYVAPKLFGGDAAAPVARGLGVADPSDALLFEPLTATNLGDDVLLETRRRTD